MKFTITLILTALSLMLNAQSISEASFAFSHKEYSDHDTSFFFEYTIQWINYFNQKSFEMDFRDNNSFVYPTPISEVKLSSRDNKIFIEIFEDKGKFIEHTIDSVSTLNPIKLGDEIWYKSLANPNIQIQVKNNFVLYRFIGKNKQCIYTFMGNKDLTDQNYLNWHIVRRQDNERVKIYNKRIRKFKPLKN